VDERTLTEGEADVMEALWALGRGTVREVNGHLPALAYTSIGTWLKILEGKGFVRSTPDGRRLVYEPTLTREEYLGRSVNKLTSRWFGGSRLGVLRQLVEGGLSEAELAELRRLVDEKLGGKP
jgi:predicted transcriptional regulator